MAYTPYYPGGWQSGEQGGTPITPAALNYMENGIKETANEKILVITGAHLNTNAYNTGSNGWEDFTYSSSQWPDGYNFGGFSAGGAGNGLLSLCKIDYNSGQKLVRLLLRNDTATNIAANATTVQCNVIIIRS